MTCCLAFTVHGYQSLGFLLLGPQEIVCLLNALWYTGRFRCTNCRCFSRHRQHSKYSWARAAIFSPSVSNVQWTYEAETSNDSYKHFSSSSFWRCSVIHYLYCNPVLCQVHVLLLIIGPFCSTQCYTLHNYFCKFSPLNVVCDPISMAIFAPFDVYYHPSEFVKFSNTLRTINFLNLKFSVHAHTHIYIHIHFRGNIKFHS